MGSRLTLAEVKASRIPEAINISPNDSRLIGYVNEASERLLQRGKYFNTYAKYRISVTSQILALPPQLATIETVAVSKCPLPLRSMWFQFLQGGWGPRSSTLPNGSGVSEVLELGHFPTIVDIATPGVLTLKCDFSTDVGKKVLVLGFDNNTPPNWIRTLQGGVYADGELVALSQVAGTNTVNSFSQVTGFQPPTDLDGQWWVFLGGITGTLLANPQYFETDPLYPRYLVPFVNSTVSSVDLVGKKAFIAVKKDSDYVSITNLAALKYACMACKSEEEHNWVEANLLWNGGKDKNGVVRIGALTELNYELTHFLGDGQEMGLDVRGSSLGMSDPVDSLL